MSQRLGLKSSNKLAAFQSVSIYYTWENTRKQYYNNNKLKITAPTWNDVFESPDGSYSVSDIQGYINVIKKHETLTAIPLIYVYINRINNRLVFKIKNRYKIDLQTPVTMKLFGITKKLGTKSSNC